MKLFKFIYLLLLCSVQSTFAQKPAAAVFVSNHPMLDEGIQLKWLYNTVYHPDGFIIHRKEGNGNWSQLTPNPIKVVTSLPSSNNLSKDEKDLHKALATVSYEEFKTSIVRAFVLINCISNNELAKYAGIYYIDKTAEKGKTYQYKVSLASGEEIAISSLITRSDYTKIEAPQEVNVFRTRKSISVNWKPEIYRYYGIHIYKKKNSGGDFEKLTKSGPIALNAKEAKVANSNSKFFIDTNIVYEESYTYKLVAVDYFGLESEFSKEISAPAQDFIPPTAPYNLKLFPSSSKGQVVLNWNSIDEDDLSGFKIYYSKSPNDTFQVINSTPLSKSTTTFIHENLLPGPYFYVVSSVDFANNESFSNPFTTELKDVTPPSAPSNFKTESISGEIKLTWSANTEGDLAGYYIEKALYDSTSSQNKFVIVNALPIKETSFSEKLAMNIKNKFVYRVIAVDTNYNRSSPSINSLAQMPDVIAPLKPVIKNISLENQIVKINWLANSESDLLGYEIYRMMNKDTNTRTKINFSIIPITVDSYLDRTAQLGFDYSYQMIAMDNNKNNSEFSEPFIFKTKATTKETNIVVSKVMYNSKKKQVTIQWDINEEAEMKGYVVYQKDEKGALKPVSGLTTFKEFIGKIDQEILPEYEIRGYTIEGNIIKSEPIKITK